MADSEAEPDRLLSFIEAQIRALKKTSAQERSHIKMARVAAAMADITGAAPPDLDSSLFLSAWRRAPQCHHLWGPSIGGARFCTKCQVPLTATTSDKDHGPTGLRRNPPQGRRPTKK